MTRINPRNYIIGLLLLAAAGCDENLVLDRQLAMPDQQWHWKEKGFFEVNIEDTTCWYSMYVNTRITNAYPYSNLWVLLKSVSPSGDTSTARIELNLFEPDGRPTGLARGTVLEYRIPSIPRMDFSQTGTWRFSIEQNMRVNTLPGVLDIGIALEKGEVKF